MSSTALPPSVPPSTPTTTPPVTVSPSVTYSSPSPTSTTPTSTPTSTSPTGGGATAPTTAVSPPYVSPSTTPTPTPGSIRTSSTTYSSSVLTEPSTRVFESSSTITSDGQVYTTQIQVTTILNPGTVVNSSSATTSSSSSSNTGAIVGGVIGGTAALIFLGLLAYFLFNKKRRLKDEFDGNFDPLAVAHSKHSPHPSLGGGAAAAATTNPAGRPGNGTLPHNPDEDDGMGGRIARGADGGGVISPYPFASPPNQPLPPSHHPQMSQYGQGAGGGGGLPPGAMMALGAGAGMTAAAYNNENPQHQGHHRNPSNISSVSSGNYTASNGPSVSTYLGAYNSHPGGGGPGYQGQPGQFGQYLGQPYPQRQGQHQPSVSPTNTTSSGGGGLPYASYNNNPYAPPIGRGPSPGPSVGRSDTVSQSQYTSSSGAGGGGSGGGVGLVGRTAKEIEAFGGNSMSLAAGGGGMMGNMPLPRVVNPDDGPDGPQMPEPQAHQGPGYFGTQPTAQSYYNPSAGSTISGGPVVTSPGANSSVTTVQPSSTSKPGLITLAPSPSITSRPLVQHQDAGRVEENPEAPSEIPPAYDSLPDQIRR